MHFSELQISAKTLRGPMFSAATVLVTSCCLHCAGHAVAGPELRDGGN